MPAISETAEFPRVLSAVAYPCSPAVATVASEAPTGQVPRARVLGSA